MPQSGKIDENFLLKLFGEKTVGVKIFINLVESETPVADGVELSVYYLPMGLLVMKSIFPCLFPSIGFFPYIYEKEEIELVHGHSSMSAMMHDSIWFAKALKLATVLTDHSLIGFADAGAILSNKLLEGI